MVAEIDRRDRTSDQQVDAETLVFRHSLTETLLDYLRVSARSYTSENTLTYESKAYV